MSKIEAPAFSMAINDVTQKITIRVDEGKFMDSQYYYDDITPTPSGIVQYKTVVQSMIVNGVYRDALEVENQFPEVADEFRRYVTSPVLDELLVMLNADDTPEPPKIILQ